MENVKVRYWKPSTDIDTDTYWDYPMCRDCKTHLPRGNEIHICRIWIYLHWPACYCYNHWIRLQDITDAAADPLLIKCYRHQRMNIPFQEWNDYLQLRYLVIGEI